MKEIKDLREYKKVEDEISKLKKRLNELHDPIYDKGSDKKRISDEIQYLSKELQRYDKEMANKIKKE